ncbi:MAG: c-type cytochrome [Nevskiales bacterium]|nr:c-type cytochrome [Nevskiales bacterium]
MKRIATIVLLGLAPIAAFAQSAVPEKAAACAACHGEGGAKPIAPNYPILAGQYANYLAQALNEYRSGGRKNPVMAAQAATLTDADIQVLAQYFSEQEGPLYTPSLGDAAAQN